MFYLTGACLYCFFSNDRRWQLVSAQIGLHIEYRQEMADAASKDSRFLILEECDDVESGRNASVRCKDKAQYFYPQILQVLCVGALVLIQINRQFSVNNYRFSWVLTVHVWKTVRWTESPWICFNTFFVYVSTLALHTGHVF